MTEETQEPLRLRFAVFLLKGNHLIHPMYSYTIPDNGGRSYTDVMFAAMTFRMVTEMEEPEGDAAWFEVKADLDGELLASTVMVDLTSRAFEHGGAQMYCIAGPAFEEASIEAEDKVSGGGRAVHHPVVAFTKTRGPGGWMSNMSAHPLIFHDSPPSVTCRTAEHMFQARRIDPDLRGPAVFTVLAEPSPMGAKLRFKALVRDGLKLVIEPWTEADLDNMRFVVRLKLDQHPSLRTELSATGEGTLIEDTSRRGHPDRFWGAVSASPGALEAWEASDGTWWIGQNWLGRIWMNERSSGRLL